MRVGIIELLTGSTSRNWAEHTYNSRFRKQFASIMPQAVAVWCRQLGHQAFYATYYGQKDPMRLLPDDLDFVFISTFTHASALAYSLAKLYRRKKVLTVIGGPHANAFPTDCLRFFDIVVQECDKSLIDDILQSRFNRHSIVKSCRPLENVPSVQERLAEIKIASFARGRPSMFSSVPILSSLGCPYKCDFCVEWNKPFVTFPTESIETDLRFVAENFGKVVVAFHDPNMIDLDRVLGAMETIPLKSRNPYALSCSLSVLKNSRLARLRETNCAYVGLGVESWNDYSTKAGTGKNVGWTKLERIAARFAELHAYVPSLGACFIFGTNSDEGDEPIELTKEFIRRVPYVWPAINTPAPFGGTALYENCLRQERILKYLPFHFYFTPYLAMKPLNYSPVEYYEKLVGLISFATSLYISANRVAKTKNFALKTLQELRTLALRNQLLEMKRILRHLKADKSFRRFHEGQHNSLPNFYYARFKQALGGYAELLSDAEMVPELDYPIEALQRTQATGNPAKQNQKL